MQGRACYNKAKVIYRRWAVDFEKMCRKMNEYSWEFVWRALYRTCCIRAKTFLSATRHQSVSASCSLDASRAWRLNSLVCGILLNLEGAISKKWWTVFKITVVFFKFSLDCLWLPVCFELSLARTNFGYVVFASVRVSFVNYYYCAHVFFILI